MTAKSFFVTGVLQVQYSPVLPGEDERVVALREDPGALLIAVLDGCGGSGSKIYPEAENWTGARLASHEAGRALQAWFHSEGAGSFAKQTPEEQAESLKQAIRQRLGERAKLLTSDSLFKSRMGLKLPTTLSAVLAQESAGKGFRLRFFWAGNSRGYFLTGDGLHQATWDDTAEDLDPYEDLRRDGILSNTVNISRDFQIHCREVEVTGPCIILSASDGAFSGFRSPVELEGLLLETMLQADSPLRWESALDRELSALAGDDCTLQLAILGFPDYDSIRRAYAPRWKIYRVRYGEALKRAQAEDAEADALRTLWDAYKADFLLR